MCPAIDLFTDTAAILNLLDLIHCIFLGEKVIIISGAPAREARSGAPWVRKCGKLPIQENLLIT